MIISSASPDPNVPTRAMACLLGDLNPEKLDGLRSRFPSHIKLFDVAYTLGDSKNRESPTAGSDSGESAIRALIEETMGVSGPAITKIQSTLTSRIMSARQTRLVGSIVATVSSAGAVASMAASVPSIGPAAISALALAGSIAMLVGEHLEKPVIGGAKSLSDLLSGAIIAESTLKEVQIRLLTEDLNQRETLIDIARKVNEISATIRQTSVFGGVSLAS